jgi:hypothetical protein
MTVISSWTATPRRIEGAMRICAAFPDGRVPRRVFGGLLAPPALRKGANEDEPASIDEIVAECVHLRGLAVDGPDLVLTDLGRVALSDFRGWCRDRLLHPEGAKQAGQDDFPRVLAWLLTVDPRIGLRIDENQAKRVEVVLGQTAGLGNNDSFRQFLHWARYLGFAWWIPLSAGATKVIPDPTDAIRDAIPRLDVPTGKVVPLGDLVKQLGSLYPVLEEGTVRTEVEGALPSEERGGVANRRLSGSTGLALRRLEKEGRLVLTEESDASAILLGPSSATMKRASHVALAPG